MTSSILIISEEKDFIRDLKQAFAYEMYALEATDKPVMCSIPKYPLVLIFSKNSAFYLEEIRKIVNVPIIVIDQNNKNVCKYLELGADDCMIMPINFKELVARCRAVVRRAAANRQSIDVISYNGFNISKESYEVRVQNLPVALSSKEFEITYFLASNPNRVMTRDEILDAAFGKEYDGDLRAVDVHIKKIRDKIYDPKNEWEIKTVRGVGYKFSV